MKKKLISLILAASMCVGTLIGCGSNEAGNEKSSQNETEKSSNVKEESSSQVQEEVDPFAEKVTLEVLVQSRTGEKDWNEYFFVKKIEELFNVDLQIEMIDNGVWEEKLPLRFASKELPDFIICNYASGAVDTVLYGEQGFLADLTDYINEETAPNIMKMWEEVPSSKASITTMDGAVYSINGVDNEGLELDACRFYIREDWAMKILGKLPENTDEFYEYLKGVKEQDMDGDGDPNNEIPLGGYFSQGTGISALTMLRAAYGLVDKRWQVGDDGQVFYTKASDNYKEMLKYVNMLYEEELLDQEFFTMTSDQFKAKDSQYVFGAYGQWGPFQNKTAEDVESGKYKVYVGMPAMTSPVNDTKMWPTHEMKVSGQITVMKDCENIDRVVALTDWLLSDEGFLAVLAGPQFGEDENYPQWGYTGGVQDYVMVDEDGNSDTYPEGYESQSAFIYAERRPNTSTVPFYRNWTQVREEGSNNEYLAAQTVAIHGEYFKAGYPKGAVMTSDESDEWGILKADIEAYTEEMEAKMMLGELDIDETWDIYLEGLQKRGVDTARQIYQDAYDRYLNNK